MTKQFWLPKVGDSVELVGKPTQDKAKLWRGRKTGIIIYEHDDCWREYKVADVSGNTAWFVQDRMKLIRRSVLKYQWEE